MDRLSEWNQVLGGFISDPSILEQASALLCQDDALGLDARTPEQLALAHQLALMLGHNNVEDIEEGE